MAILVILCIIFVFAILVAMRLFIVLKKDPLVLSSSIEPVENIHDTSLAHQALLEDNSFEIKILQQDFDDFRIKKEAEEKHLLSIVDQLKQENQQLQQEKESMRPSQEAEPNHNEEIFHLRAEVSALRGEVQASHQERDQATQEKETLKSDFERKIQEAQHSLLSAEETYKEQISLLQSQIDQQAKEIKDSPSNPDPSAILLLEEETASLMKKNDVLQQELTKSRVQITSLQRMCENLQKQVQQEYSKEPAIEPNGLKLRGF